MSCATDSLRRIVGTVLALVIAVLGCLTVASAANAEPSPKQVQAHGYNFPDYDQPTTYAATQRGLPVAHVSTAVSGGQQAVDRRSHGTVVRSEAGTIAVSYTYEGTARLVKVANSGSAGRDVIEGSAGDLSSLQRSQVAAKSLPRSLDALSRQGAQLDRNGLTQAGRALQKHANRAGNTAYPKVPGNQLNRSGQDVLDDILTHPQTAERSYVDSTFGPVREFLLPDVGARFEQFGRLIGFL